MMMTIKRAHNMNQTVDLASSSEEAEGFPSLYNRGEQGFRKGWIPRKWQHWRIYENEQDKTDQEDQKGDTSGDAGSGNGYSSDSSNAQGTPDERRTRSDQEADGSDRRGWKSPTTRERRYSMGETPCSQGRRSVTRTKTERGCGCPKGDTQET